MRASCRCSSRAFTKNADSSSLTTVACTLNSSAHRRTWQSFGTGCPCMKVGAVPHRRYGGSERKALLSST